MSRLIRLSALVVIFISAVNAFADYSAFEISQRVIQIYDPTKATPGLCPENPRPRLRFDPSRPISIKMGLTAAQRAERDRLHLIALNASGLVYDLPDLETPSTGLALIEGLRAFIAQAPQGYAFHAYFSEPESGLKYVVLRPKDPANPWVLSIAGTQTIFDLAADLSLGRMQLDQVSRLVTMFTTCRFLDGSGEPIASHPVIVTGHSLGGGLAQAFAYRIQKSRMLSGLNPLDLHLVTFNAFGAQELIEQQEAYVPWVVSTMDAANYFVHGDIVSRIGTHIGQTYELTPAGERATDPVHAASLLSRHSLKTIQDLVESQRLMLSGLAQATPQPPQENRPLNELAKALTVARYLPSFLYHTDQDLIVLDRIIKTLDEAVGILKARHDPTVANYVRDLIDSRLESLALVPAGGIMHDTRVNHLRNLQNQLH